MEIILGIGSFVVMFGMWVVVPRYFHGRRSEEP